MTICNVKIIRVKLLNSRWTLHHTRGLVKYMNRNMHVFMLKYLVLTSTGNTYPSNILLYASATRVLFYEYTCVLNYIAHEGPPMNIFHDVKQHWLHLFWISFLFVISALLFIYCYIYYYSLKHSIIVIYIRSRKKRQVNKVQWL